MQLTRLAYVYRLEFTLKTHACKLVNKQFFAICLIFSGAFRSIFAWSFRNAGMQMPIKIRFHGLSRIPKIRRYALQMRQALL